MSAVDDNKKFLTGVLSNENLNFTQFVFGLWVSTFENPNSNNYSGYSMPKPLIDDIIASPFAITGRGFSLRNSDGKINKSRFFITSGVKGEVDYESLEPIAEITDSYISGSKPYISMPGVNYSGKIFRRYEIIGTNLSRFTNEELLVVSGEDWKNSELVVSGSDSSFEYKYFDTGYSGYSNEVIARYKFLYDDSELSQVKNSLSFDVPVQLEDDSSFTYRIARKSDPLGSFFHAEIDSNGKVLINLRDYKDEISKKIAGGVNYNFSNTTNVTLSFPEISRILNDDSPDDSFFVKKINDATITGVKIVKNKEKKEFQFSLLAAGNYSGVYKLDMTATTSAPRSQITKLGYVMSGYSIISFGNVGNVGNAGNNASLNNKVIAIAVNSSVYPRVIDDGNSYDYRNFLTEEEVKRNLTDLEEEHESYSDEDSKDYKDSTSLKNNLILDGSLSFLSNNISPQLHKTFLPDFQLPKKTIPKDYYSNYLNSGESYITVPIVEYSQIPNPQLFVFCGDHSTFPYLSLGTQEAKLINTTTQGLRIEGSSFCKGDSALDSEEPSDRFTLDRGTVTKIPDNGIVKKENYTDIGPWKNAVNYFYTKNYVSSFSLYPSLAKGDYFEFFNRALSQVRTVIGYPSLENLNENSFTYNKKPIQRIFVEREIYTEPYEEDQISEFNREFSSESKISSNTNLNTNQNEKLYCVQSYGYCPFDPDSFFPTQSYNEKLTFQAFYPHDIVVGNYASDILRLKNFTIDDNTCLRVEYIIGVGEVFNFNNYSQSVIYTSSNGVPIVIANQDERNYAYHLYQYENNTDALTLVKSNVKNGVIYNINLANGSHGVVLKFSKKSFENILSTVVVGDSEYQTLSLAIVDANLVPVVNSNFVKFNIQTYTYKPEAKNNSSLWYTFSKNPINNNQFGDEELADLFRPRFFEDAAANTKDFQSVFLNFPNGPVTSKNHEGSPIVGKDLYQLANDLFENEVIVTEENANNSSSYKSHCILDFVEGKSLTKQKPSSYENPSFSNTKRLRISKIQYNFYTKNLVIIGDAGSRGSTRFNYGWEYELQYKKIEEENWKQIAKSVFSKNEIICNAGSISPYYHNLNEFISLGKNFTHSLSMMAFETNLPLYLDDAGFEFKIVKYKKLEASDAFFDVIKKVNFIPIQVSWSGNSTCSRFNIYQKDTGNSLTLLGSEGVRETFSYVVPDVRQSYIDMGITNFGFPNYSGYYDIVISGVVASTTKSQVSISGEYGFQVGDTDSNLTIEKISNSNANTTFISITGVTYSPMLNFNNPESKNSNFEINQNYSGYYFVTNSATGILNGITGQGFEAYVANTGSTTCRVFTTDLSGNGVAIINGTPSVALTTLQNLPSSALDLSEISIDGVVYLKSDATILNLSEKTFYLINDSDSLITFSGYSINATGSLIAGKTSLIQATNSSLSKAGELLSNINIQDDYIYSNGGLTNFDHTDLMLVASGSGIPIYNASQNPLVVNDSLVLNPNSFNFVNWDGTNSAPTPSGNSSYFNNARIYLKGTESENFTALLKNDTEIIIVGDFESNTTKTYFFIKDESVARELNVKIKTITTTDHLSTTVKETLIPSKKQNFKLIVTKKSKGLSYEVVYAFPHANYTLTDGREQTLVLKSDNYQIVDLDNVENFLYQNSFVYFFNKGYGDAAFVRDSIGLQSISQNQMARLLLRQDDVSVQILENAHRHFKFDIPTTSLSGSINILNLDFCETDINFPSTIGVDLTDSTLLICKNRLSPNRINKSNTSPHSSLLNDGGDLSSDSIFLDVYKNETDGTFAIRKTTSFELGVIPNEATPDSNVFNYFYISDENLSNFTLQDFYNRKVNYAGKIFSRQKKEVTIRSFDEKNIIPNLESTSLSFNYDPDGNANGRLVVEEKSDEIILSSRSEKGSTAISFITTLLANQICANFAYDTVNITTVNKTLKKNRLIYNGTIYPIYNKDEFFIVGYNYYYKITELTDVDSIIIPDSLGQNITIRNYSSKSYGVKNLSNSYSNLTILPNKEITLQYSSAWNQIYNGNFRSEYDIAFNSAGVIQFSNQSSEISSTNPLSSLFVDGEDYSENFIPNGLNSISAVEGELGYKFIDIDSAPSASAEEKTMFCFGRRSKIESSSVSKFYFINDFYLYAEFNQSIVRKGEIWVGEGALGVMSNPLTIIKRQHIDLSKNFKGYFESKMLDNSRSVIFIPITSHLVTYYLPNLSQSSTNDGETLGSKLNGKKIVFINLVKNSTLAPNQVINYSNSNAAENLIDINSLLVYSASTTTWTKQTSSLPIVTTVYPTLTGVKGITNLSDSTTTDGDEMVYLSNFNKFYVGLDSFKRKEYGNFYIYNSCRYPITITETDKDTNVILENASKFLKIERNPAGWLMANVAVGNLPSFILTSDKNTLDQKLSNGTVIKLINEKDKTTTIYEHISQGDNKLIDLDKDAYDLNLEDLKNYDKNDKLFIYKSPLTPELLRLKSDPELLKLKLIDEKFYIHNSTTSTLKVLVSIENLKQFLPLPASRTLEISKNGFSFMETHSKGTFYVNGNLKNRHYLSKSKINIFIDPLPNYEYKNENYINKFKDSGYLGDQVNIIISLLKNYNGAPDIYVYDFSNFSLDNYKLPLQSIYNDNLNGKSYLLISNEQLINAQKLSSSSVKKTSIKITSAGHYIINNNDKDIRIGPNISGDIFLVNNCAQDISVYLNETTTESFILFRNTVLVINNGEIRYLKKAKQRDEFYCVFNPKTTISLSDQETLFNKINRTKDILQVFQEPNSELSESLPKLSYVKLLSKTNQSVLVHLSLEDYYRGIDIPTNSPENVLAYEIGIGHETIYKFLFFDPSKSTYTLPGIESGEMYMVNIDVGLFYNLENISRPSSDVIKNAFYAIYNGQTYKNGDFFTGGAVSNYEVKYPNYVKVAKVMRGFEKTFTPEESEVIDTDIEELSEAVEVNNADEIKKELFKEIILEQLRGKLGGVECWIPMNETAFWQDSAFQKDIYTVKEVFPLDTFVITSETQSVSFVKCLMKKSNLRQVIRELSTSTFSALQYKRPVSKPDDLMIDIDYGDDKDEIKKVRDRIQEELDLALSFLEPAQETMFWNILFEDLWSNKNNEGGDIIEDLKLDISIALEKLKPMPTVEFENLSNSSIIKLLNGEEG